ncbi:MAG: Mo-dependent nitrogenase C-terminal domain-containing protein [Kaiparowitsia implicata GSE-PSE-MK54-09C]|jgi:hypothetical protein|nr:Mo-dependent nitrogenase C-terminal domain-containing protein [Kaiparowitsia implicata GSE-PSE-MK54-09C]
MKVAEYDTQNLALARWVWIPPASGKIGRSPQPQPNHRRPWIAPLSPLRNYVDAIAISNAEFAHTLCRLIPAQCPFERDINLLGHTILHIPPLCKLNPLYEEVVALRFRALCYLADECDEDITQYC